MKQNKYDDQGFFDKYKEMPRSIGGLESAGEWPALKQLIPNLKDKRVLDLGCGYGWHCRYAREHGARSVVGVDISAKMLERAKSYGGDPAITYIQLPIEDIDFAAGQFDVVISSLALHYIADFEAVCRRIAHALTPGGTFVLSVEHPVFTARAAQDWHYGVEGERLHWPIDDYQSEGLRQTRFLDNDVVKYHRTLATLLNALISTGFTITQLSEPQPTPEAIAQYPDMRDETRRPIFLLVAAVKGAPTAG
ncbi:class I SAM-dependent methyltransferase [Paenibacillus sp. MMS18-CY102]|uniref:class I SAM-dependent methyltransferase n=1 Tax=Paenibacillus sp. MMS18-CY102 TaxID=2682849 RepID=UPI0013663F20|nr:class I SAM-dependent methyltransferase [Paenibacillus sp. MMS18-CY102]MWC29368.1 methyltransferase domain-containing protein [Paenibacillus sp. MMS18-CY102]